MKIAHLSDTHLGFSQFSRSTGKGWNMREVDVLKTFQNTLNAIAERDPDLVLHSGDFFHRVRPSNAVLFRAFQWVNDFQRARGYRPFVIIAGNHETSRTSEGQSPLEILSFIEGVEVVSTNTKAIDIESLDTEILAIPTNGLESKDEIDWIPSKGRKHKVLMVHGMEAQVMPEQKVEFTLEDARMDRWDYIAMGDYHVHKAYARNICYAGSTDFASTNIWEEISTPKGWVWFDTEDGKLEFVRSETRRVVDLKKIDAEGMSAKEVNEAIDSRSADLIECTDLPIVRQVIWKLHPQVKSELDRKLLARLREVCLDYQLTTVLSSGSSTVDASGRPVGETLEESWLGYISQATIAPSMTVEEVANLGTELIKEARENEAAEAQA